MMSEWDRASLGAVLALACPALFGGVLIRAGYGPVLDAWINQCKALIPDGAEPMVLPSSTAIERLQKSISVARSLSEARVVYQTGAIEAARGKVLLLSGVERLRPGVSSALAAGLDENRRQVSEATAFLAIDESRELGESVPTILSERLAFRADLTGMRQQDIAAPMCSVNDVKRIATTVHASEIAEADLTSIASACAALGISSMRVPIYCMHAAQALAALNERTSVSPEDITLGCQLVLPGRGHAVPEEQADRSPAPNSSEADQLEQPSSEGSGTEETATQSMESQIIEAVASAPVQLAASSVHKSARGRAGVSGRSGAHVIAFDRGRPDRPVRGQTDRGRVDLLATLRAAVPLQTIRNAHISQSGFKLRTSDLRVKRFKRRKQSSVIFVVDASGSAAMHRMAEAKGAVERLLSQCYTRRDLVSLIAFSGDQANLVLPPSRSLVRARRQISDLTGGGATPLAHALVEAYRLACAEHERGRTPFLVFLTDGRGNISLEGNADRQTSIEQVSRLARTLIKDRFPAVFFDTSRRPDPRTRKLSNDLGAQYQFLPNADGETVSRMVRQRIGSR